MRRPQVASFLSLACAGCWPVLAAAAACNSMPSFGGGGSSDTPPPPPPAAAAMPSKYAPEEFVGRWGFTSYQKEPDRARTINTAARGLCKPPYVIAKGPNGGVMMHLADERQPSELRLKGSPDGKNYIGPDGDGRRSRRTAKSFVRRPGADHALRRSRCRQPLRQHGLRALRRARRTPLGFIASQPGPALVCAQRDAGYGSIERLAPAGQRPCNDPAPLLIA